MFLGYILLQLFCSYSSWHKYCCFSRWMSCTFTLVLYKVCVCVCVVRNMAVVSSSFMSFSSDKLLLLLNRLDEWSINSQLSDVARSICGGARAPRLMFAQGAILAYYAWPETSSTKVTHRTHRTGNDARSTMATATQTTTWPPSKPRPQATVSAQP